MPGNTEHSQDGQVELITTHELAKLRAARQRKIQESKKLHPSNTQGDKDER